ncbi:MAG: hypothetical protein QNJ41_01160 [Xenococcaceae cyanobacterium MO_188.B32]|nr:hypothetical protein [Xenococcaceae cyanobacterium MO_188.B32]
MASQQQLKTYLAYWFQLGKKVFLSKDGKELLPQPVIRGDRYSQEFEDCWQKIIAHQGQDCYLEGTEQTIEELLSPTWTITSCARCNMPVPMIELGIQPVDCPCNDLDEWPNSEIPQPRSPINTVVHLSKIQSRLQRDRV